MLAPSCWRFPGRLLDVNSVTRTLVPAAFRILRKFARRKTPLRVPPFADPVSLRVGDVQLLEPRLSYKRGHRPKVGGRLTGGWKDLHEVQESVRNKPITVELSDGSTIAAEHGRLSFRGLHELSFALHHWRWRPKLDAEPVIWLGTGDIPAKVMRNGQLLTRKQVKERGHGIGLFHIVGHHDWLIFPTAHRRPDHPVAILPKTADLAPSLVHEDVKCLSFTLGVEVEVRLLFGMDASGRIVRVLEVASRIRKSRNTHSPVFEPLDLTWHWHAEFFRLLMRKVAEPKGYATYLRGFSNFLDSLDTHFDAAYVLLQVGLESLLKNVATDDDKAVRVKKLEDYKKWVRTIPKLASEHFNKGEDPGTLVNPLDYAAHPSPVAIMKRFFLRHGIELQSDLIDEVRSRNQAVHDFLTVPDLEYVVDDIARRQNMIRTLIAAVTAMAIGYDGPLTGYDWDDDGGLNPPKWWTERPGTRKTKEELPIYVFTPG